MKSFVPGSIQLSLALSLAPCFSEVLSAGELGKPFQRFLRAGCKPLKRFARSLVADTRLKPGANKREAFAVAQLRRGRRRKEEPTQGFSASRPLCAPAPLR